MSFVEAKRRADLGAVRLSDQIERDLMVESSGGPVAWVLAMAKSERDGALARILETPAVISNLEELQTLQMQVERYGKLVRWLKSALALGRDAWSALDRDDQEEIASMLLDGEDTQEA